MHLHLVFVLKTPILITSKQRVQSSKLVGKYFNSLEQPKVYVLILQGFGGISSIGQQEQKLQRFALSSRVQN